MQTPLSFKSFPYAKCWSIKASSAGVESLSNVGRGGMMRISQLFIGGLAGVGLALTAGATCCVCAAGACADRTGATLNNRVANKNCDGFMRRIVNCAAINGKPALAYEKN